MDWCQNRLYRTLLAYYERAVASSVDDNHNNNATSSQIQILCHKRLVMVDFDNNNDTLWKAGYFLTNNVSFQVPPQVLLPFNTDDAWIPDADMAQFGSLVNVAKKVDQQYCGRFYELSNLVFKCSGMDH